MLDPLTRDTAYAILAKLNTPRSLAVYLLLKYQEYDTLRYLPIDPANYLDVTSVISRFRKDYQATHLLRKLENLPVSVDLDQVTVEKWYSCEATCHSTNLRFMYLYSEDAPHPQCRLQVEFLRAVRKNVRSILGPLVYPDSFRHGPGKCVQPRTKCVRMPSVLADKYSTRPAVYKSSVLFGALVLQGSLWGRLIQTEGEMVPVKGAKFALVPKDSRAHRPIGIEAALPMYLQLGYGKAIRDRLRRAGNDLPTGGQVNFSLAQQGSTDNSLATIDLSSASDTISREVVKALVPRQWFKRLDSLRAPHILMGTKPVYLSKFSSMGNGFTFELESLLFLSICRTVVPRGRWLEIGVYGDDIIVPREYATTVLKALQLCGFSPNMEKTFITGPFRESCGGHFFLGEDVTPVYFSDSLDTIQGLIRAEHLCFSLGLDDVCSVLVGAVPKHLRVGARRGTELIGFHSLRPRVKWKGGIKWQRTLAVETETVEYDRFDHLTNICALTDKPGGTLAPPVFRDLSTGDDGYPIRNMDPSIADWASVWVSIS